jgi:hypothetical protein
MFQTLPRFPLRPTARGRGHRRAPAPGGGRRRLLRDPLDQATLDRSTRLDEALATVPAVSLFRRTSSLGANPTTQGISLRAIAPSGAGRTLVTLDGVPLNDPFGGWVLWSQVAPESLESLDIVRGAGAGPYGAGALTGVIALRERDHEGGALDASVGEDGGRRLAAATTLKSGRFADYRLGPAGSFRRLYVPCAAPPPAPPTRRWIWIRRAPPCAPTSASTPRPPCPCAPPPMTRIAAPAF